MKLTIALNKLITIHSLICICVALRIQLNGDFNEFVLQMVGDWKEGGNLQLVFYLGLDTACSRRHGQKSAACQYCILFTIFTASYCLKWQLTFDTSALW